MCPAASEKSQDRAIVLPERTVLAGLKPMQTRGEYVRRRIKRWRDHAAKSISLRHPCPRDGRPSRPALVEESCRLHTGLRASLVFALPGAGHAADWPLVARGADGTDHRRRVIRTFGPALRSVQPGWPILDSPRGRAPSLRSLRGTCLRGPDRAPQPGSPRGHRNLRSGVPLASGGSTRGNVCGQDVEHTCPSRGRLHCLQRKSRHIRTRHLNPPVSRITMDIGNCAVQPSPS